MHSPKDATSTPKQSLWPLAFAALGVVYGDIGTSPLYALRECFHGPHAVPMNPESIMGILSLVCWTLFIVICFKYMLFVLRADNRGEGGILALTALACPARLRQKQPIILMIGLFGAALLYGDGVITPAISVLSAVEGLTLVAPKFSNYVIPLAVLILFGLFYLQCKGSGKIGIVFGPIILLWFTTLAALGVNSILLHPQVMESLNPIYALNYLKNNYGHGFQVLGAVFLVITGGEAMYADLGHFGRKPIQWAWFAIVLPGLLLNYFGQGALLLTNAEAISNPFYLLAPSWALIPLIILATLSTVIASQALISGVFSLTRQAIQLGFWPRSKIVHTSSAEIGQIYMPHVNWFLFVMVVWLVVSFGSSSKLAAAYGISVSGSMVITTLMLFVVAQRMWRWPNWISIFVFSILTIVDIAFFASNSMKIEEGGWFPLLLAGFVFLLMTTWKNGRRVLAMRLRASSTNYKDLLKWLETVNPVRVQGTALFMVGDPDTVPPAFIHNVKHNRVLHEKIVMLTVLTEEIPHVAPEARILVENILPDFYRIVAHYGFMESPNIADIIKSCQKKGLDIQMEKVTFFLGRESLIASSKPGMAIWREHLFAFMSHNAQKATAYFNIPPNQVIELGIQIEI